LAAAVRLHDLTADGLWYDELLTVTRAYPSFRTAVVSMWEQAVHPPLFQGQLHFWLQLGTSDLWVRLNPFIWDMLSLLSLIFLARRVFSTGVALLAALFLAISPLHVFYGQETRMYSMMIFLAVWAWFCTHQFFTGRRRLLWAFLTILACLAYLYSHGAGFMILVSTNTFAAWLIATSPERSWKRIGQWFAVQAIILGLYLPWLVHAYQRGVAHTIAPSLQDVVTTLNILVAGLAHPLVLVDWLQLGPLALLLVSSVAVIGRGRQGRGLTLAFVWMPILFCYAVSYLVKPIWLFRTLAYTVPFICLVFALACTTDGSVKTRSAAWRGGLALLIVAVLAAGLVAHKVAFQHVWVPREATTWVAQEATADDAVLVPNERLFWSWCWYFVGPGSIDPLHTPIEVWSKVGVHVVRGTATTGRTVWVITHKPDDWQQVYSLLSPEMASVEERTFQGITVTRMQQRDAR
jgi:mannosyltransferase